VEPDPGGTGRKAARTSCTETRSDYCAGEDEPSKGQSYDLISVGIRQCQEAGAVFF
jgi:hypothetical protein